MVRGAERAYWAGSPPVARHDAVPWKAFLASRTTWLLWAQYFFFSYCWYFYVTWLPTFLKNTYGSATGRYALALLAGGPLFGRGFCNLISGVPASRLVRAARTLGRARQLLQVHRFSLSTAVVRL